MYVCMYVCIAICLHISSDSWTTSYHMAKGQNFQPFPESGPWIFGIQKDTSAASG